MSTGRASGAGESSGEPAGVLALKASVLTGRGRASAVVGRTCELVSNNS